MILETQEIFKFNSIPRCKILEGELSGAVKDLEDDVEEDSTSPTSLSEGVFCLTMLREELLFGFTGRSTRCFGLFWFTLEDLADAA